MTSLKSCFNFKLFFEGLKQQKYLMILHTIVLFMISTLPALVIYNNAVEFAEKLEDYRANDIIELLSGYNPYMMMLLTAAAVVTAIFCFNYLFKHQSVQFYHSMPHTRECIYISKFLSGAAAIVLPVILIYAVNSILYFAYGLTAFTEFSIMFKGLLTVLLLYICVYSVACFASSVSGNFFAQLIITAFIFLVYLVSTAVIMVSFESWFDVLSISFKYNEAYLFPPLLLASRSRIELAEYIFIICYTFVFFAAGLVLFKFRKSESTGKFFAYKTVPIFLKYYVAFFASLLFGAIFVEAGNGNMIISYLGYILAAFVVFIALQGIFGKSFKSMFTNIKSFVIFAVIICAIVSVPLISPDRFDNRLPETSNVDAVEVMMYNNGYNNDIVFKEYNNISECLKLFSYNNQRPEEDVPRWSRGSGGRIIINPEARLFTLSYNRNYITDENYGVWYSKIYDTNEYKQYLIDGFDVRNSDGTEYFPYVELYKHRYFSMTGSDNINKEIYYKIKEAYINDLEKYSYEDISKSYVYAILHVHNTDMKIYKCFEDTIKIIEDGYVFENMVIDTQAISKVEFRTYSYENEEHIVLYETTNQATIDEIMERAVQFGNTIEAVVYYDNGDTYGFSVNYNNLPAHIKNSIANQ